DKPRECFVCILTFRLEFCGTGWGQFIHLDGWMKSQSAIETNDLSVAAGRSIGRLLPLVIHIGSHRHSEYPLIAQSCLPVSPRVSPCLPMLVIVLDNESK